MSGLKNDKNKPDFTLIPIEVLESAEKVLAYGAKKYARDNWRLEEPTKYISAMWRHFLAFCKDNNSRDSESDLLHIEHVLVNAIFLVWFVKNKKLPIENENWQNEKFDVKKHIEIGAKGYITKPDFCDYKSEIERAYNYNLKISFVSNGRMLLSKTIIKVHENVFLISNIESFFYDCISDLMIHEENNA